MEGRGRVYFRIGVKGKNTATTPRYARVKVERYGGRWGTGDDHVWYNTEYLYIRQGRSLIILCGQNCRFYRERTITR